MKAWALILVIVVYVVYVVVGGFVFMALEREEEEQATLDTNTFKEDWLGNHSCVSDQALEELLKKVVTACRRGILPSNETEGPVWNAYTSIYFAVTVVTTIGYGNISPATTGGRVFCIFFAIFGIPLALVMFAEIGRRIAKFIEKVDNYCMKCSCQCCMRYEKVMTTLRFALVNVVFFLLFIIIPALIFHAVEEDWTIGEGIYYSFITLTTIGFGDYVAGAEQNTWNKPVYRLMIAAWIIIGLSWMSSLIALTQDHMADIIDNLKKKKQINEIGESKSETAMKDINSNRGSYNVTVET